MLFKEESVSKEQYLLSYQGFVFQSIVECLDEVSAFLSKEKLMFQELSALQ
jgi:hypothetical protein